MKRIVLITFLLIFSGFTSSCYEKTTCCPSCDNQDVVDDADSDTDSISDAANDDASEDATNLENQ